MTQSYLGPLVITGTPLIGEGNAVDNRTFMNELNGAGIPALEFYPDGPLVRLGRWFHVQMSMSTKKTMHYAAHSGTDRSSFKLLPLKWELRRSLKKARSEGPHARCFITSQNMMAEEASDVLSDIPAILFSSDVNGKFHYGCTPSERQKRVIHLVWNREALHYYKDELKLPHVHLTLPTDPKDAFAQIKRDKLPYQEALTEPNLCFIKLSGSGGDPMFINKAILSLWAKSRTGSIVFPGVDKTQKRLVKTVGSNVKVSSSLDSGVFYNQLRQIITHEQMFLAYPSEQVKHIAILALNNVFPKVAWLPPRGQHEMHNLAWAIKKGFSGTVCIPVEYWGFLRGNLIDLGISTSDIELVEPEKISKEHFKPTPSFQDEKGAVSLEHVVRGIINS